MALPAFEVFFFFAGACAPPSSRSIRVGDRYQRLLHVFNEPLLVVSENQGLFAAAPKSGILESISRSPTSGTPTISELKPA